MAENGLKFSGIQLEVILKSLKTMGTPGDKQMIFDLWMKVVFELISNSFIIVSWEKFFLTPLDWMVCKA